MPGGPGQDALPRICFVHVPKTGGTSVRSYFMNLYREASFWGYTTEDYVATSGADLLRYQFFAGHTYQRDWSRLPANTMFFTILRDPVERAISLYRYWNTIDSSAIESRPAENAFLLDAIRIARTRSVGEFVASDCPAIVDQMRGAYANQFVPGEMINWAAVGGASTVAVFRAVVERLFSFSVVLTTEQLDLTFPRAVAQFGLYGVDTKLSRENVSNMELKCDRCELKNILAHVSPIDFHIYAVAQQLEARYLQPYAQESWRSLVDERQLGGL